MHLSAHLRDKLVAQGLLTLPVEPLACIRKRSQHHPIRRAQIPPLIMDNGRLVANPARK